MHDEIEGSWKTEVGYEQSRVEDKTEEDLKGRLPIKSQHEKEIKEAGKEELCVPWRVGV